jgi:hypothetical protein
MTNFVHHQFATRVLRASATLTLIVLALLANRASAQLTLGNFTSGQYVKHLNIANTYDVHYAALPPNSPLGAGVGITAFQALN